jgi:hypothetical protein
VVPLRLGLALIKGQLLYQLSYAPFTCLFNDLAK